MPWLTPDAMSVSRYSRSVKLDDLENVHALAVLAVPPGSRVLDLGAADGSVARVLAARGCRVTAVERDAEGVATLRSLGIDTIAADLEDVARAGAPLIPEAHFDVVLLLDVLEHLAAPGDLLARVRGWLAPGGRVLISVPHAAHAAVRLVLLQGRFPRTDIGLLDRTHLQFFDRPALDSLVSASGLRALDVLTVERGPLDTEVPLDREAIDADALAVATADPTSRIYQFFVVADAGDGRASAPGLLEALAARFRSVEASYRQLEAHARQTEAELARLQARAAELEGLEAAHAAATARLADLADVEADRDMLRRLLRERMAELERCTQTIDALMREVDVLRGYASTMVVVPAASDAPDVPVPSEELAALMRDADAYRQLSGALAFRAIARIDGWLRRLPRVRKALRTAARAVAGG